MQIISHNTTPVNKWHGYDPYGNHFRLNDLSVADWIKSAPKNITRTKKMFYEEKDKIVEASVKKVFNGKAGAEISYNSINSQFSYEMKQILGAQQQWEKFANIKANESGNLIGLDIETFGNVRFGGKSSVFGITEIGIVNKAYGTAGGEKISLAIGITDTQLEYLNKIVEKYENSSWDMLTQQEQVDLGRASVYANAITGTIESGTFAGMTEFKSIGNQTTDLVTIKAGIEKLASINQKTADVLPKALGYVQSELQKSDTVFSLANGSFDLDSILNVLRNDETLAGNKQRLNLIQTVKDIKSQELDIVYAVRAMAGLEGVSVETFMEENFGIRVGAAVDEQMKARHIAGEHVHFGVTDVEDQIKVLENLVDEITRTYNYEGEHLLTRMQKMRDQIVERKANELYLFHHGQLNKTQGLEFAGVVNSKGKRIGELSYSFTNEFWVIDQNNSKYIDVDGEQKYALTFINAAELAGGKSAEEATTFTIVRDSMVEAFDYVEKNARAFVNDKKKVTNKQILAQQEFKYADFGRREFDKMQDVASVVSEIVEIDGKRTTVTTGGYESFSRMINLEKAIGSDLDKISGSKEKIDFIMNYIKSNYDSATTPMRPDSYYEAQAFIGMHKKLKTEMPLLNSIKLRLDNLDASTEVKTALLSRIYDESTKYIDKHYGNKKKKNHKSYSMSDVFGVDIELANGEFRRINTYDIKTAQSNINSILNTTVSNGGVNRKELVDIINNLYERNLIIDTDYSYIMRIASDISKDGLYDLAGDIANSVTRSVNDMFEDNTRGSIISFFGNHVDKTKNLRFLGSETQEGYGIVKFKNLLKDKKHKDAINDIITSSINQRATVFNLGEYGSVDSQEQIKALVKFLGLKQEDIGKNGSAAKIISEIFVTKDKDGNELPFSKRYTLKNYDRAGIKSFIVMPDENSSAFILMTREEDAGRLQQQLLNGKFKFESRQALIDSGIYEYGAFEELKSINRYQLSDTELLTVTQGENFEKILTPYLNTMEGDDGVLRAYFNEAEYDFYAQHRKAGGNALDYLRYGEYESASKLFIRTTDNYLQELSASASYRGVMVDGEIKRIATFGPGDFIQAREQRIVDGLKTIFEHGVVHSPTVPEDLNVAQQIVHAFGASMGMEEYKNESMTDYHKRVMKSAEFNEFFHKRLYVGTIGGDENFNPGLVAGNIATNGNFNQNFFGVINEIVGNDVYNTIYGEEVVDALSKLHSSYRQILNEKKVEKGIVSTVDAADYNSWAILHNAMRPTFGQQNNGMYFGRDSMKEALFTGLFDVNGDIFQKSIFFNTVDITEKELRDKLALSKSGYNPFGIDGYDVKYQERNFTAQVKQMSNFELQNKYIALREGAASINAKEKYGITNEQYKKALDYFEKQLMSLHEDKIFIATGLNEQELFASRDAKKLVMDWEEIDSALTKTKLENLIGTEINSKTVIGVRKDGSAIFYDGPAAILTKNNVEDLLAEDVPIEQRSNRRMTRVLPTIGDIADNKIMMNGAEKATVHAISSKSFAEYIGLSLSDESMTLAKAREISNQIFGELSGGAVAIANMGGQKHATMMQTHSLWNTMSTMYQQAGYGKAFVDYLNSFIGKEATFNGLEEFKWEDSKVIDKNGKSVYRLITDTRLAKNASDAIEYAFNHLLDDNVIKEMAEATNKTYDEMRAFNESVVDYANYMKENNILLTVMQRQTMNEHMGTRVVGDDRIRQAILTRGIRPGGDGIQDVDVRWSNALDEFSKNYDGKGNYGIGKNFQDLINIYSQSKNEHRIAMSGKQTSLQKSVFGIVESLRYINDPSKIDVDNSNIVKINIQDLIKEESRMKGGLSSHELQNSIFFVDGDPSEFLKRHAEASNVNLKGSYSIYIDLGDTQMSSSSGDKYNGMLIPIQSVFGDTDDKIFFKNTQGSVVKLINDTIEAFTTPSVLKLKNTSLGGYLSEIYLNNFKIKMENQISLLDKDSDAYKAFNNTVVPVSHQVLAQDEVSPLIDAMFSDRKYQVGDKEYTFKGLVDEKTRLERILMDNSLTDIDLYAKQYDEIQEAISNTLKTMADDVKNDPSYYAELIGGEANHRLLEAGSFFDIDPVTGKSIKHYGLSVAMGVDAFENMGFDLGVIGVDVVNDYLTKSYEFENIHTFAANNMLHQRVKQIAKEFEESTGYHIEDPNNIIEEINKYIQKEYNVNTRDLNAAIAENKDIFNILNPFREIGISYMEQVGTYAELLRYPMFRSQPAVRLMLDRTMAGNQLRSSSPILSYLSHVDHDGDTEFIMAIANGMSILKSTDKRFQDINQIFRRFGKEEYRELLAESIESMGGLKSEMITDIKTERAQVLKKFHEDLYNQAIDEWKTSQGIGLNTKLTPSQEIQAHASSQMADMFAKHGFNSIEDHEAFISAMAARVRKINIGKISTPNYTLRNALLSAYNDKNLTTQQRQLINDTYFDLSNMFSEAGGLFSMTEQKVIDPKHGRDGMIIARTTKYSTGMSRLFAGKNQDDIARGLKEIIEAIGPGIFGTNYEKDINKLVQIVLNNEMNVFKESEKWLHGVRQVNLAVATQELTTITDETTFYALKGLRGLVDIKKQIPGFNYKNSLDKGSFEAEIYEIIESIVNATDRNDVNDAFKHTAYENLTKALVGKYSSEKTYLEQHKMYFISGGIGHKLDDTGFVFEKINKNGKYVFQKVNLKTGKIDYKNRVEFGTDKIFDKNITPVFATDYKQNAEIRKAILEQIKRNRVAKSLDVLILDKKGNINTTLPDVFYRSIKVNSKENITEAQRRYYEKTWVAADQIFNGAKNYHYDKNAIDAQYKEIGDLLKAYDYAVATQNTSSNSNILKNNVPDNSGELIRQINQQIVDNAEKYGSFDNEGYFSSNEPYLQTLRNLMSERFVNGRDELDKFVNEIKANPNFDVIEYNKALDFLNENSYDIIGEEAKYNQIIASIDQTIEGFRKEDGLSDGQLEPLYIVRDRINKNDFKKAMESRNYTVMTQAQNRIYKAIGNTKESLSNYFKFNTGNVNEMKVGFGQYIGQSFSNLSQEDVNSILEEALKITSKGKDNLQTFAAQATYDNLKGFKATKTKSALSFKKTYSQLDQLHKDMLDAANSVRNVVKNKNAADIRKLAENMNNNRANHGGGMEKKTLSNMMLNSIKTFDMSKFPVKEVGIGAAGLMALGLVNKILHKGDKGSPLSPARNDNQGDTPGTDNGYGYAPPTATQTIYADNSSGIQYRVTAKSKNFISDSQNARLINMGGGGTSQVYSSSDTSGVTDNWLANKFAELA